MYVKALDELVVQVHPPSQIKFIIMKEKIIQYLLDELYPVPSCDTCKYSNTVLNVKRYPCHRCDGFSKYQLHKGHLDDVKRMAKDIVKIVKEQNKKL